MHYFEELIVFILMASITALYLHRQPQIHWQVSFMEASVEITKGIDEPKTTSVARSNNSSHPEGTSIENIFEPVYIKINVTKITP